MIGQDSSAELDESASGRDASLVRAADHPLEHGSNVRWRSGNEAT
jgi:hypothetical protein